MKYVHQSVSFHCVSCFILKFRSAALRFPPTSPCFRVLGLFGILICDSPFGCFSDRPPVFHLILDNNLF